MNSAVLDGKLNIAPGFMVTEALGVRRFADLRKTIGIERKPQENYGTHWYQSGARTDKYSQYSTLSKALRRHSHKLQNPTHTNATWDPNYARKERPTLETLQKGVAGNLQQLDRRELESGIVELNRVQNNHALEQIANYTDNLHISARETVRASTKSKRLVTDNLKKTAMTALAKGSIGNERRVPYNVLYDMEFVDMLTRVRNYQDLQNIYMFHRNMTFLLSLPQLEVMLKTHAFRNARCLRIAYDMLWSDNESLDLMKAQVRTKDETHSKELLDERLEEIEGLDDIRYDSEDEIYILD